jgi:hypothetical protein
VRTLPTRRTRLALGTALGAVGIAAGAAPAPAAVELRSHGVVTVTGAARGDRTGTSVAVVAGAQPLVLAGAPGADGRGRANAGAAYLVRVDVPGALRLADVAVLRLHGAAAGDRLGASVAAAGDVNGDGAGDLLVGAPGADAPGRPGAGAAYVVFGGGAGALDAGDLGGRGFRIDGPVGWDADGPARPGRRPAAAGTTVAAAGDVDGDGLADLLVSAPGADNPGLADAAGRVFVVFGKADGAPVDLGALGPRGFAIAPADDGLGLRPGLAGGVDAGGDGVPDVAFGADVIGGESTGTAIVAFGARPPADVAFASGSVRPPASGFAFSGRVGGGEAGWALALTGDMTGDGRGELVVGSPAAGCTRACFPGSDENRRDLSGSVDVVWGRADPAVRRPAGFRIDGPRVGAGAGTAVAAPGDLNGDRVPDVALGAPGAFPGYRRPGPGTTPRTPGSAFVVFGSRSGRTVDLARPGSRGFVFRGARTGDRTGSAVAGGADLDDDGRPDVVVGAPRARDARGTFTVVPPPATALSHRTVRLVGGRVPLDVRCLAPRGRGCRGVVVVRTARRVRTGPGRPRLVVVARKRIAIVGQRTTRLLFRGTHAARRLLAGRPALRLAARASVYVSSSVAGRSPDPDAPPPRPTTSTTARFTVRTGR